MGLYNKRVTSGAAAGAANVMAAMGMAGMGMAGMGMAGMGMAGMGMAGMGMAGMNEIFYGGAGANTGGGALDIGYAPTDAGAIYSGISLPDAQNMATGGFHSISSGLLGLSVWTANGKASVSLTSPQGIAAAGASRGVYNAVAKFSPQYKS